MSILLAEGLTKIYHRPGISVLLGSRGRGEFGLGASTEPTSFCLSDVSFELEAGTSLGVIGRNGAGKSTLLRLLSGLSKPTSGRVQRGGSLRALLDLGAGFLDEMTGTENALVALALDGVTPRRRVAFLKRVLEFAEIGSFVDQPLRTYSNGMRLRLGYALAIASSPDILVTDEILAVGDESFQRKCSQHVADFLAAGGTMVLASHNLYHVEKLCQRAIWLDEGRVMATGPARQVTSAYRAATESMAQDVAAASVPYAAHEPRPAPDDAVLAIVAEDTGVRGCVRSGGAARLEVAATWADERNLLEIVRPDGTVVAQFGIDQSRRGFRIDALPLLPGRYVLRLVDQGEEAGRTLLAAVGFECIGESRELGAVRLRHSWEAPTVR